MVDRQRRLFEDQAFGGMLEVDTAVGAAQQRLMIRPRRRSRRATILETTPALERAMAGRPLQPSRLNSGSICRRKSGTSSDFAATEKPLVQRRNRRFLVSLRSRCG